MTVRIALDAMGGDHAPQEVVAGAAEAARTLGAAVTLFGPEAALRHELNRQGVPTELLSIVDAPDVIAFDEAPVQAVRHKRNSSLVRAIVAVKEGEADAVVSAGSTGALLAGGLLLLGRIKGIDRPALATPLPTPDGVCLVLDVGANTDNSADNLLQFAQMGAVYAEAVFKVKRPRVALLNNGTEEAKGSALTKAAHQLLQASGLHYTGYTEARDVFSGAADVIVTDGFTGNVLLKSVEGTAQMVMQRLQHELTESPLRKAAAAVLRPGLRRLAKQLDYSEYGGAPFLGVQGAVIKCHGSSRARAIFSGIRVACEFVKGQGLQRMSPA